MSLALVGILGIFILLLVLFFLGMPVGFAMGIVGFGGFCYVISVKAGLNMLSGVLWETFSKYGLTVIEVPISADYRDEPKRSVFTHGLIVLRDVPNLVSLYRPSLFFGAVSSLALLAVVSLGVIVIEWMREMGQLVIGYPSLPVLLHLIGVIVITTGIMLISIRTILTNLNKWNER